MASKGERTVKVADKGCTCITCGSKVKEKELSLQCEVCDGWSHAQCEKISEEVMQVLQRDNFHWYCTKCNSGVGKMLKVVIKMQERLDVVEDYVRKVDEKMVKMKEGILSEMNKALETVNRNMKEIVKEHEITQLIAKEVKKIEDKVGETTPKWSEIVAQEVDSRFTKISSNIDLVQKSVTDTQESIMENQDKLKRMNNIIMYNVEESKSDSGIERNNHDLSFCGSLMEKVLKVGYEDGDIIKVIRLGRYDAKIKRPLLVEFTNAHVKNVVMGNVTNLGSAKDVFEGVTISHDMTIKEREQCKSLVEEAKQKQSVETGNFIYRVRGLPGQMKIVKFRKG